MTSKNRSEARLRRLTPRHMAEAHRLSMEAGWNQTVRDWERILELEPNGCFGAFFGESLAGTVTLASLGPRVAWIGMMLVSPSHRGQGVGRTLFRACMEEASRRSHPIVGLDATDLGRPLYESEGFRAASVIHRWSGILKPVPTALDEQRHLTAQPLDDTLEDAAIELDHRHSGVDRRGLLRTLLREPATTGVGLLEAGELRSFVVCRPGEHVHHVGPMVTERPEWTASLLNEVARLHPNRRIFLDAVEHPAIHTHFETRGLSIHRTLTRMTWPEACSILESESLPVITSFEWG